VGKATSAHLSDHVFPRQPVRQWVLSVPKRLRYFMQRDGPVLNMVLRIFLRVIAQTLQVSSPGAATVHPPAPLLWRAGTQFAAQGCGHGDGTGRSGAT